MKKEDLFKTTVHLYYIDSDFKVLREFHGYKAASEYFNYKFNTTTSRVFAWRRHWRCGTLTLLKKEHYKEIMLHRIETARREIVAIKERLREIKKEYRKHF